MQRCYRCAPREEWNRLAESEEGVIQRRLRNETGHAASPIIGRVKSTGRPILSLALVHFSLPPPSVRNDGNVVPVERRNADTLLPLIEQHILPGTTIISDCWAEYGGIERHYTINHSQNFVDPETAAHTNTIEGT